MSDVALFWDNDQGVGDIAVAAGDLAADDTLATAALCSLHCDARARPDDELPDPNADPRGWWADSYADVEGDAWGSRLWLFKARENTPDTRAQVQEAALEALQWMIDDQVAQSVAFEVLPVPAGQDPVGFFPYRLTITAPNGDARTYAGNLWGGQ